ECVMRHFLWIGSGSALASVGLALVLCTASASAQPLALTDPSGEQMQMFGRIFPGQLAPPMVNDKPVEADREVAAHLRRQIVAYRTREAPGTVIVDTPNTYLYYV